MGSFKWKNWKDKQPTQVVWKIILNWKRLNNQQPWKETLFNIEQNLPQNITAVNALWEIFLFRKRLTLSTRKYKFSCSLASKSQIEVPILFHWGPKPLPNPLFLLSLYINLYFWLFRVTHYWVFSHDTCVNKLFPFSC